MSLLDNIKKTVSEKFADVKIDNEGLDLITVKISKDPDPKRSRAIVTTTNQIGLDFPGDSIENALVMGFGMLTGGELGNSPGGPKA